MTFFFMKYIHAMYSHKLNKHTEPNVNILDKVLEQATLVLRERKSAVI